MGTRTIRRYRHHKDGIAAPQARQLTQNDQNTQHKRRWWIGCLGFMRSGGGSNSCWERELDRACLHVWMPACPRIQAPGSLGRAGPEVDHRNPLYKGNFKLRQRGRPRPQGWPRGGHRLFVCSGGDRGTFAQTEIRWRGGGDPRIGCP
eukprot:gene24928-biopygen1412